MDAYSELRAWTESVLIGAAGWVDTVVPSHAMRVGPNTDAVVWKLCDTNETVEL